MSKIKRCGNAACSCAPSENETYCSPHCEALSGATEIACACGHALCAGEAGLDSGYSNSGSDPIEHGSPSFKAHISRLQWDTLY